MPRPTHPLQGPDRLEDRDLPAASFAELPVLPAFDPATLANVRRVAYTGQLHGLRTDAFMKLGDSNTYTDEFLQPLGRPGYNPVLSGLAAFGQEVLETYYQYSAPIDAAGRSSFARRGATNFAGWTVPAMLTAIDPELVETRAGVGLVLAGTNDIHIENNAVGFRFGLTQIVHRMEAAGVVPVLSTIPWDRLFGLGSDRRVIEYNQIIADVAADEHVPVINLWRALEPLPNNGLKLTSPYVGRDFRHLSSSPLNPGGFSGFDLLFGQNVRHLLTLQTLAQLRNLVFEPLGASAAAPAEGWAPLGAGQAVFAVGSGAGEPTVVTVCDAGTGEAVNRLVPYDPGFHGGVCVAVGDVSGDGVADVVTGPGLGGGPLVRGFSGADGGELFAFLAYEPGFRGGVNVAVGDADGDGDSEVAVGAGVGGSPRVRVFDPQTGAVSLDFVAFDPGFRCGVTVAVGTFDGRSGVAVGAGEGGAAVVQVFDGRTGGEVRTFTPYGLTLRGGVSVAAGDLDGDGADELVVGAGEGGTPHVRVLDPSRGEASSEFLVGDPADPTGVRVAEAAGRVVAVAAGGQQPARVLDRFGEVLLTAPVAGASVGG